MNTVTRRQFAGAGAELAIANGQSRDTYAAVARQTPRNLLTGAYPPEKISAVLVPREKWRPYPPAADRSAWEALPAETRQRFIQAGEKALKSEWPVLSATRMLEYVRHGNRTRYDSANAARRSKLHSLVMAETVEGKGRFLDEVTNGIWLLSEQSFWGSPAHVHYQKAGAGLPNQLFPPPAVFGTTQVPEARACRAQKGRKLRWLRTKDGRVARRTGS